jgi:hypothetical protein
MNISPEQERLLRVFHPYALDQLMNVASNGTRFVHYTSAEVAMNILRTKEVWMKNASCMNDFMEVEYGLDSLRKAYSATDFKSVLDQVFNGITGEIENLFNGWTPYFRTDTYLSCVSEHLDQEDLFGRLSMWRAYGGTTGVALVLNNSVFLNPSTSNLNVYSSPVAYLNYKNFENEFRKISENIRNEGDFLKTLGRDAISAHVFHMFKFAALCTKHPGFSEEREWRAIYCPTLEESQYLIKDIQVIGGVPQPIYKIPLKNIPEAEFDASVSTLLDRIIIGPTQYPLALKEAFEHLLREADVSEAENKVWVSDIPLRRWS